MKHSLSVWLATIVVTLLLTGCGGLFEGEIQVRNSDPTATITSIYISENCEDEWGNPDATSTSIPPGGASEKFEFDIGTYDVRACFDSGTCGERRNRDVSINDTNKVGIIDEGKPIAGWCS